MAKAKAKGNLASVKVVGLAELYRKLDKLPDDVVGPPARRFMQRATDIVAASAVKNAPTDRGMLRNSIQTQIDSAALPKWGKVGTNTMTKDYAKVIEFGRTPGKPPPPPGPLAAWMTRKGIGLGGKRADGTEITPKKNKRGYYQLEAAFALMMASQGTPAKPFLTPALTTNKKKIRALLPIMAREIEEAAEQMP